MRLIPEDAQPGLVRALAAGALLVGLGYVAELAGKAAVPGLRIVGVFLAFVGMGVFLLAGVFYLVGYLYSLSGELFG